MSIVTPTTYVVGQVHYCPTNHVPTGNVYRAGQYAVPPESHGRTKLVIEDLKECDDKVFFKTFQDKQAAGYFCHPLTRNGLILNLKKKCIL